MMYLVTYTDADNKTITKSFYDHDDVTAYTKRLDVKIERGMCLGYIMSCIKEG